MESKIKQNMKIDLNMFNNTNACLVLLYDIINQFILQAWEKDKDRAQHQNAELRLASTKFTYVYA